AAGGDVAVDGGDPALGVDVEGPPTRVEPARAEDAVRARYLPARIGEHDLPRALRLGEGAVVLGRVEADEVDGGIVGGDRVGGVPHRLHLAGAAGRERLREPGEHD